MRARRLLLAVVSAAILIQPIAATCPAAATRPTLIGRTGERSTAPAERWYIAIPGGDEERLVAVFDRLSAAGATHMQAFLPDLIVCDIPIDVNPHAIAAEYGARPVRADAADQLADLGQGVLPARIERVYREGKAALGRPQAAPDVSLALADRDFCEAVPVSHEEMRASAAWARERGDDSRLIHQNTEIFAGRILVHVILPESDFPEWPQYEDWTNEAIAQIKLGLYFAVEDFQDYFENAQIEVMFKYHERVLIRAEPIKVSSTKLKFWMTLTMAALGYPGPEDQISHTVHAFNEDARARVGADWAFSMFLASAAKAPDHTFPDARTLTFTRVGGPFFVSSYPAGHLTEAWGMSLVAKHEFGHMFWGTEEDDGPVSSCSTYSGYLNVDNANKVTQWKFILGSWQRTGCREGVLPVPCTQNEFDMFALYYYDPEPCDFTRKMFGVSDVNENLVPDAFDRPPRIEFDSADVETVITAPEHLGVTVYAEAIPNDNPLQPPDLRRDYASPIRNIDVSVGGLERYTLLPEEIQSDGYVASFEVNLPPPLPGPLRIRVSARNSFEAQSAPRIKTYMYVDLAFVNFEVTHPVEGVQIEWKMLGETFDANLTAMRRNLATGEVVVVAEAIQPVAPKKGGVTPYRIVDDTCEIGATYEYWIHGSIDLPHRTGSLHKQKTSRPVRVQGAVPRTRVPNSPISNASPNPFRERTWVSVSIPDIDEFTGENPQNDSFDRQLSTPVKVNVYDVLGRRVARLFSRNVIGNALTLSWDGTNASGAPLPSGVYFLRVSVGPVHEVRKVLLVR